MTHVAYYCSSYSLLESWTVSKATCPDQGPWVSCHKLPIIHAAVLTLSVTMPRARSNWLYAQVALAGFACLAPLRSRNCIDFVTCHRHRVDCKAGGKNGWASRGPQRLVDLLSGVWFVSCICRMSSSPCRSTPAYTSQHLRPHCQHHTADISGVG